MHGAAYPMSWSLPKKSPSGQEQLGLKAWCTWDRGLMERTKGEKRKSINAGLCGNAMIRIND